ncbi:hypothetical protein GCM10009559_66320 [Pseudonocardia zijingensis]|uniref:Uncharacterized protein n=1 Tax=Pseudonocardia zijingensis TaxID=153376 RepID=A0ABN1NAU2_9PSEU
MGVPSGVAEYWAMGDIQIRWGTVTPLSVSGLAAVTSAPATEDLLSS